MVHAAILAGCFALSAIGSAQAEAWHVIAATKEEAVILDGDSVKSGEVAYATTRTLWTQPRAFRGMVLVADQFTFEIDCKGHRLRTVDFAVLDAKGQIAPELESKKIRDWDPVREGSPMKSIAAFACTGQFPSKPFGPVADFAGLRADFLQWAGGSASGPFDASVEAQRSNMEGWQVGVVSGDVSRTCRARRNGRAIDLVMMLNKEGKPILAAANPTWARVTGEPVDTVMAVDDGKPETAKTFPIGGMYFNAPSDALVGQLRTGKRLAWSLPTGSFQTDIAGFDGALDGLRACMAREDHGTP